MIYKRQELPMHKKFLFVFLFIILAGCSSSSKFNMAEMTSTLPGPPAYKDPKTIEEIEALKPQLKFPIKLAITQPLQRDWGNADWTPEELNLIDSWGTALKEAGFANEIVVLPRQGDCPYNDYSNCKLEQDRKLAARFHADALLAISTVNQVNSYANWLGIFDLTIAGMFIMPAHHVDSYTILEGMLIDNRNEYLYAFQRTHSEVKHISPLVYTEADMARKESRQAALRSFGEKMIAEVKKYSNSKPQ